MEQKQLDELEDSFFGEEFIEDLEDLPPVTPSRQEIKIEPREQSAELRLRKTSKKIGLPAVKKSAFKKSEKSATVKPKELVMEEKPAVEKVSEVKSSHSVPKGTEHKEKEQKEKKTLDPVTKKETVTVSIKPAKESVKETKPAVETSSPVNPWEDDTKESGLFKETSTWKALTGVALVLLVLSLFTQGFNFSEKNALTGAAAISLEEAELEVLEFVNTQLLQAPFQAELQSSEELDTLYRVTLEVAGQVVDSYVTKDGKLFFPQGLNMDELPLGENAKLSESGESVEDPVLEETVPAKTEEPTKPELAPEEPQEAEEPVGDVVKVTLNAKKWVFTPNVLRVKKGSKVVLTVVPTGLDFTFAVPSLGVEKKVSGTTEVEFAVDRAGTFDFTCSSCEDWRGMRGNLVVEASK